MNLIDWGGIVLDGRNCELYIFADDRSLSWNPDEKMGTELHALVNWLRTWPEDSDKIR